MNMYTEDMSLHTEDMSSQTEEFNISTLVRGILINFLISMARGQSIDNFINDNDDIARLIREFQNLRDSNESFLYLNEGLNETILSLQEQIDNATSIMAAQEENMLNNRNPEAISLLARAIELLEGTVEVQDVTEASEEVTEDRVTFYYTNGTPYTGIDSAGQVELHEDVSDEEDSLDDEEEITYEDIDDASFDLEDEDLEESVTESPEKVQIVKNPEITNNFDNLEDSHMTMFVFVRYSHLPYHYTLDGVRYKLVLNGSQIVSVLV